MMRSLWTAASGMREQQTNVDTISNNLANVNTAGYKTQQASFKSLLYQNLQSYSTNANHEQKPVAAEVGLGTRTAAVTTMFTQGSMLASDNPFSMAIEGDGFFQIKNSKGELLYTRDGNFAVSPTAKGNLLCTSDGYAVLDSYGNEIYLPQEFQYKNKEGELVTKKVSSADLQVDSEGYIAFPDESGNARIMVDNQNRQIRLGLYQFSNPAGLEKLGANNYAITTASGAAISENDIAFNQSKIHQRYLEGSNVDTANEMVNLIVAQRAYELNSKAIQTTDDMMQQANQLR